MWDLPGPGIKPVFPSLAGGFLTTVLPGMSLSLSLAFGTLITIVLVWMFLCSSFWNFVGFLDLDFCFHPQVREVFNHYFFK